MDPNAALREIRETCNMVLNCTDAEHPKETCVCIAHAANLAESFDGLDNWLSKGGFVPAAWKGSR